MQINKFYVVLAFSARGTTLNGLFSKMLKTLVFHYHNLKFQSLKTEIFNEVPFDHLELCYVEIHCWTQVFLAM